MESVIEKLSEEEIDSLLSGKKLERKIKYDICFNRPNNFKPKEIRFDGVNSYDFSQGFTEYLISEDFVHLYFDFDSIQSEDEFLDVWEWLEKVKTVFGSYSIGGYCDNEEMEGYGFRRYEEGEHYLSMHVVFYESAISTVDLQKIMKHTAKKGFSTKGIHQLCDPNVYKLVSKKADQTCRQLFRHVMSDKIFRVGDEKNKLNHGFILDGKEAVTQIVQIRGNERVITKDQWNVLFEIVEKAEVKDVVPQMKVKNDIDMYLSDLNVNDGLIILNDNDMESLLKEFEPTYENFTGIVSNLIHSPYDEDQVIRYIERWYFTGEHQNMNTIQLYCDKYYEKVESNKWFYSIVKHMCDEKRNEWKGRFADVGIDEDANINMKDGFTLRNLREKDYSIKNGIGIKVNEFISDLKKCVAVINSAEMLFIVKDYDGCRDTSTLTFLSDKGFERLMKSIKVGRYVKEGKTKAVNAFMIYDEGKNKNHLLKDGVRFFDERTNMFSHFTGYEYNELQNVDVKVISGFMNHIKEVIAAGDENVYEYILNWYAYILQNPNGKTGTALVLTGAQGTGKNVFTNVLCHLMNRYSNKNLTNIDHIVGKYNQSIEGMKLIVCNELSSAETNKYLNSDSLKSVITENQTDIRQMYLPVHPAQNVVNLILLSNNATPIKIENGDRRYVVSVVSDKYKGDRDYFKRLCNSFNDGFYENLFTFFMKRDVSKFEPENIPMTEAKKDLMEASKSSYELFIQDHIVDFVHGFVCSESFNIYQSWAKAMGFMSCNVKTYGSNINIFCDRKRSSGERRPWIYILKESAKKFFDMAEVDEAL